MEMDNERRMLYRRALEALRNGVPNRQAVGVLGTNQPEVEARFQERLEAVGGSVREGRQVPGILVAGGFGAGKSHLLDYLDHQASSRNFVTSRVVISKETPLFDPCKTVAAAIDNAVLPGLSGEAIREIASRLRPGSGEYRDFSNWVNDQENGLSPLFATTVLLHEQLNNDPELVDEITRFWAGERLSVSRVRQGLKELGRSGKFSPATVKVKDLAMQRLVFLSRMILAAGYSGWVWLLDEVELVGRYSLLQRGRSYAELARLMGRVKKEGVPGLLVVAAITDDFGLAVLQEKGDRETVGARLRAKGTEEDLSIAGRAETGMRLIEREAMILRPPTEATLRESYSRLREVYGLAYGWTPTEIPWAAAATTRRMRSYVRRWVNEWDLRRLYPGAEVGAEEELELRVSYVEEEILEEEDGA